MMQQQQPFMHHQIYQSVRCFLPELAGGVFRTFDELMVIQQTGPGMRRSYESVVVKTALNMSSKMSTVF